MVELDKTADIAELQDFINGRDVLHFNHSIWRYSDLSVYSFVQMSTALREDSNNKKFPVASWKNQTLFVNWRLWKIALLLWLIEEGSIKLKFHRKHNEDIWAVADDNSVFVSFGA